MSSVVLLRSGSLWNHTRKAAQVLGAALALLLVSIPVFSQTSQGTIQGAVLDQSGGAIAGSAVVVTDVARGITRNLVADEAGQYVATNLNPGTYTVRAESKGFKAVEHSGVVVEVGQTIRVDMVLQPGEQNQTVTVTGEVPAINATDATLGGIVSNKSINELPLNGRNFERLLDLRPGTVSTPGSGTGSSNTNGRRIANNTFRVEGIMQISNTTGSSIMNLNYRGGDSGSLLPIDAIQEFSSTENPKAEYGFRDGSVVNVGIKAGTNSIHGTAYAFGRDANATDAANFFTGRVTPAYFEQFGATAGGPIIKDKFFWFASYEGIRDAAGAPATTQTPTTIAGAGAANSLVDACNTLNPTHLANGAAGNPINALSAQLAGLNTATCTVTPVNYNSPTGENIFPVNNTQSITYYQSALSNLPLNNGIFKADYALNAKHHISGLVYISKSLSQNLGPTQLLPTYWTGGINNIQQYSGDWTWTPTSSWVNDLRVGYVFGAPQTFAGDSNVPAPCSSGATWPNCYNMPTGVTNPLYGGLPTIQIRSFTGILGANARTSHGGQSGDFDLVDSASTLRGKHALKVGFEYIDVVHDPINFTNASGTVTFNTLQNFLTGTLASPSAGSIALGNPQVFDRNHLFAGFLQDDWRIKPRVTLNLGVRYDFYGSPWERNNYLGNFNPNVNSATNSAIQQVGPGTGQSLYKTGLGYVEPRVGVAWDVRGDGKTVVRAGAGLFTVGTGMETPVSFSPFGANIPYLAAPNNVGNPTLQAHTFANYALVPAQINWSLTQAGCNSIFPNTTCPVAITSGATSTAGSYTGITCTFAGETGLPAGYTPTPCQAGATDPNWKQAESVQWNLDIQRAITNNLTVDVAYVGNHGFNEDLLVDLNQPSLGAGWTSSAIATCITAPTYVCKPNTAAEVGLYSAKFPYLSQIDQGTYGAYSNYDALQATVQARNYHGLTFLAGYAYAHSLAIVDANYTIVQNVLIPDKNNLRSAYGNTTYDLRHRFTFSPTYTIPGRKAPGQMLEGWSINAILTLQPGLHYTIADTTKTDWLGTGEVNNQGHGFGVSQYWNYVGPNNAYARNPAAAVVNPGTVNPAVLTQLTGAAATGNATCAADATAPYGGASTTNGQLATAALFNAGCYLFNGSVLTPPAYGTLGNAGHGFFVGPNYRNLDFSVAKLWKFKERYSTQFRAEFFNVTNHTNFGAPGTDPTKSSFGNTSGTPDSANAVLGSGGPRHVQFGLKLAF